MLAGVVEDIMIITLSIKNIQSNDEFIGLIFSHRNLEPWLPFMLFSKRIPQAEETRERSEEHPHDLAEPRRH